jgi:hypothetical protein
MLLSLMQIRAFILFCCHSRESGNPCLHDFANRFFDKIRMFTSYAVGKKNPAGQTFLSDLPTFSG